MIWACPTWDFDIPHANRSRQSVELVTLISFSIKPKTWKLYNSKLLRPETYFIFENNLQCYIKYFNACQKAKVQDQMLTVISWQCNGRKVLKFPIFMEPVGCRAGPLFTVCHLRHCKTFVLDTNVTSFKQKQRTLIITSWEFTYVSFYIR